METKIKSPIRRKKTLAWVNEIRDKLGLRPVDHLYPGQRLKPSACVIANTIMDDDQDRFEFIYVNPMLPGHEHVSSVAVNYLKDDGTLGYFHSALPTFANTLATEFDNGDHPDLELYPDE